MAALGPAWVAEMVAFVGVAGVLAALVAAARHRPFVPWLLYGLSLPVVALPHALLGTSTCGPPRASSERRSLRARRAFTPAMPWILVTLAVIDVVFLEFHRELFGAAWQYVMWEGGIMEALTPVNFLLGAGVFVLGARAATGDRTRRAWLLAYAAIDLVLAGEEISWGQGQILLDLNDPSFVTRYNPGTSLHHVLPGVGPIIIFFVVVAILRVFHARAQRWLHLPLPVGFLNAVLLLLLAAPFMRFDHEHFLFFDEVYEWSGSVLLLYFAMYERWRWLFTG